MILMGVGGEPNITMLLEAIGRAGGDTADIEVKSGEGGFPKSLAPTLSALANLPEGGWIIIGLDESKNFSPVKLDNIQGYKQALGNLAREMIPHVHVHISDAEVGGKPVVVARVQECPPTAKPCKVGFTGRAYLRSYDGDVELSELDTQ